MGVCLYRCYKAVFDLKDETRLWHSGVAQLLCKGLSPRGSLQVPKLYRSYWVMTASLVNHASHIGESWFQTGNSCRSSYPLTTWTCGPALVVVRVVLLVVNHRGDLVDPEGHVNPGLC